MTSTFLARPLALAVAALAAAASLVPAAAGAAVADPPDRPNVLFVLTEDQGAQLSFLGTPGLETPHMDSIAERGVYFERGYVNYPVCSPSKATSSPAPTPTPTGSSPTRTTSSYTPTSSSPASGTTRSYKRVQVKEQLATLTEILADAGYHNAVSGKLHVAPNEKFPYEQMFKENNRERTDGVLAAAEEAGKPFFFFANIQAPHRPFRNSDRVEIGVDPAEVELPAFLPDTPAARKDWAEYLDYTQVADDQLGEVLASIEAAGEMDDTLIVFMGDHGPAYHRGKMTLYQFGLNVPLAFAGPGVAEGLRTREMTSGIDVLPTLLDLLGLPPLDQVQGRSMAALVRGEAGAKGAEQVFAEVIHQGQTRDDGMQERSVFDGRWKLIYRENADKPRDVNSDLKYWAFPLPNGNNLPWRNRVYQDIVRRQAEFPKEFEILTKIDPQTYGVELPTFELYDTDADPDEFDNVAEDPANAETLERLKGLLARWLASTEDPFTTGGSLP